MKYRIIMLLKDDLKEVYHAECKSFLFWGYLRDHNYQAHAYNTFEEAEDYLYKQHERKQSLKKFMRRKVYPIDIEHKQKLGLME